MKLTSKIESGMKTADIFAEINRRQIAGIMMHRELSVMFSFLGLQGFKRLQEYRYFCESCENMRLQYYYIDYCNRIVPDSHVDAVKIIPADWYNAERLSVNTNTKKSYTDKAFKEWQEWEKETKDVYSAYYKMLLDDGKICDAEFVKDLAEDTGKELKKLERLIEEMRTVDYDPIYIAEIQKKMHDKYKKKMGL